ncbi:MAG: hypothetical protein ACHQ49_14290 [Elusimicrobiota bacterium]
MNILLVATAADANGAFVRSLGSSSLAGALLFAVGVAFLAYAFYAPQPRRGLR